MTDQLHDHLDLLGDELRRGVARAERRRRRALRSATAATALAAVGLGALVAVPGGRTLDPVEAAQAAVAEGGILHYVLRTEFLGPGDQRPQAQVVRLKRPGAEVWVDASVPARFRVREQGAPTSCGVLSFGRLPGRGGPLTGPMLTAPMESARDGRTQVIYSRFSRAAVVQTLPPRRGGQRDSATRLDFGSDPTDPVRAIREALSSGQLRDAGTINLGGRRVRQLVGEAGPTPDEARSLRARPYPERRDWRRRQQRTGQPMVPTRYRYLVDASTAVPVELRAERYVVWSRAGGYDHWKWTGDIQRFSSFVRLPDTPEHRSLLTVNFPAGTTIFRSSPTGVFPKGAPYAKAWRKEREAGRRCRAAIRATP